MSGLFLGSTCIKSMLFPSGSLSDEKGPMSSTEQVVCSKSDCLVAFGVLLFCDPQACLNVSLGLQFLREWYTLAAELLRKEHPTGTSLMMVTEIREVPTMGKDLRVESELHSQVHSVEIFPPH